MFSKNAKIIGFGMIVIGIIVAILSLIGTWAPDVIWGGIALIVIGLIIVLSGFLCKGGSDDLKVVEGVGPKLEGIMNELGIASFSALGRANVEKLTE